MLQNKIYLNYLLEILKTFLVILFGLSVIALTVRAVNFLDLIVENGYPVSTYFKYSLLNLSGISLKFIPFSFLLSLTIFILKHLQDNEFLILWISGVKKIKIVNLIIFSSVIVLILYLVLSIFFTPYALLKSRMLLSQEDLNSFLPTIRTQQFSDTYSGLSIIVEKKLNNEIENVFIHDQGNNLKSLSSNISDTSSTTIIAKKGIVNKKSIILLNGQILSSKKDKTKDEIIKFEQLNIDLGKISTSTIKQPKLQETATYRLLSCFIFKNFKDVICEDEAKKEIIPSLIRRIGLPLYIPVLSLICSLLLFQSNKKYLNKFLIFAYSFLLLVFTELVVRYTGINDFLRLFFIIFPFFLFIIFYLILFFRLPKTQKTI